MFKWEGSASPFDEGMEFQNDMTSQLGKSSELAKDPLRNAGLHNTLQTIFGQLHRFPTHYSLHTICIAYLDWLTFRDDSLLIKLFDLGLRVKEKFLYEYDFIDQWRHLR